MWNRQEIKEKGKNIFKANYWKAVGASLVMLFLNGAFNSSRANKAKEDFSELGQSFSLDQVMMFAVGTLFVGLFDLFHMAFLSSWEIIALECPQYSEGK